LLGKVEVMTDPCQENYFSPLGALGRIAQDKALERMSHFLPQVTRSDLHLLVRKIDS